MDFPEQYIWVLTRARQGACAQSIRSCGEPPESFSSKRPRTIVCQRTIFSGENTMPQRLSRSMAYIFVLSAFFLGAGGTASANRHECKDNCSAAHDLYARECNDTLANRMSICLTKQGANKEQCMSAARSAADECLSNAKNRWDSCVAGCDTAYPQ